MSIRNNAALTLDTVTIVSGNLTVQTAGNISQTGSSVISVGGRTSLTATLGTISLGNANEFTGAVAIANTGTGTVTLSNNKALFLGNMTVGTGNLAITAINGNVTRAANATLVWAGQASIQALNGVVNI